MCPPSVVPFPYGPVYCVNLKLKEGLEFVGYGPTKQIARHNAALQALHALEAANISDSNINGMLLSCLADRDCA